MNGLRVEILEPRACPAIVDVVLNEDGNLQVFAQEVERADIIVFADPLRPGRYAVTTRWYDEDGLVDEITHDNINITGGRIFLYGSTGDDIIENQTGLREEIWGNAGDDYIIGGTGQTFIDGGDGHDTITTYASGGAVYTNDDGGDIDTIYSGSSAEVRFYVDSYDVISPQSHDVITTGDSY
jgi:Ca2+-binding RTX toxin-like protein